MKNQSMRITLIGVLMTTLAALGAGLAYGHESERSKKVEMEFAGALLLNLEQQRFSTMGIPLGTTFTGIAQTKAIGNLGWADVNVATQAGPPISDRPCPDGFMKIADINENNIVFTFFDLSLLYGNGQGVVCLSLSDHVTQFISVDGEWTGGTRRFAKAKGKFSIVSDTIVEISPNTQFSAETGRITGFLR